MKASIYGRTPEIALLVGLHATRLVNAKRGCEEAQHQLRTLRETVID